MIIEKEEKTAVDIVRKMPARAPLHTAEIEEAFVEYFTTIDAERRTIWPDLCKSIPQFNPDEFRRKCAEK